MKDVVVSVWDSAAEAYSSPVFAQSKGAALRSFIDAVADPKTDFFRHPEHFSLFLLGSFDRNDGVLAPLAAPQLMANAWELNKQ